ncbi:MAG: hypothetical protein IT380_04265 [Myxococcales bacterium]|nr:hypothetical protein [Myxococcales bacterium]
MRTTVLLTAAALLSFGCATSSSSQGSPSFDSRLPNMGDIVKAARAQSWGAELKQIPAVVVEVGSLSSVPYMSFGATDLEINVYGDPAEPAGIEIGTKSESPEVRAQLRAFLAGLLSEADRKPLDGLADGAEVTNDGLALEITPPTAVDGFGAWWVTAFHPAGVQSAKVSVGEVEQLSQAAGDPLTAPLAFSDVGFHPAFSKYPRYKAPAGGKIWATSYYKQDGVYRRR